MEGSCARQGRVEDATGRGQHWASAVMGGPRRTIRHSKEGVRCWAFLGRRPKRWLVGDDHRQWEPKRPDATIRTFELCSSESIAQGTSRTWRQDKVPSASALSSLTTGPSGCVAAGTSRTTGRPTLWRSWCPVENAPPSSRYQVQGLFSGRPGLVALRAVTRLGATSHDLDLAGRARHNQGKHDRASRGPFVGRNRALIAKS